MKEKINQFIEGISLFIVFLYFFLTEDGGKAFKTTTVKCMVRVAPEKTGKFFYSLLKHAFRLHLLTQIEIIKLNEQKTHEDHLKKFNNLKPYFHESLTKILKSAE